MRFLRV
nr:unnamed protein product [Callosobruchus analis]